MLHYFTALVMFLIGMLVGAAVVFCSQLLGVSGWVTGPIFCLAVLAFIYLSDRFDGFLMRHVVGFLAKSEGTQLSGADKSEIEKNFTRVQDYWGFLAGAAVGTLTSLLTGPSSVLDWLPF